MFDFGFSELVVIGVVMLIVVGPERLPKVARTVGHLLGRLQRYVSDVKSDIQREMQLEELKKLQEQVKQQAHTIESSVREQAASVEAELGRADEELRALEIAATGAAPVADAATAAGQEAAPVEDAPASTQLELGLASPGKPAEADKA
ncbi:Sec-independent protein translocase protein TatB [Thauera sinica]|uniref:Sec-independent protein translocase protein TatB n=1 Tax=Thauera sinica TaxID=2665146 RepID=A0ABW1AXP7_9RHOO|nr:Sec-independent protein translocase protein TatB [Thauera sp. K11]ATE62397.1 twin-arginine translocase subunit TatB [Thauera sp. K11]